MPSGFNSFDHSGSNAFMHSGFNARAGGSRPRSAVICFDYTSGDVKWIFPTSGVSLETDLNGNAYFIVAGPSGTVAVRRMTTSGNHDWDAGGFGIIMGAGLLGAADGCWLGRVPITASGDVLDEPLIWYEAQQRMAAFIHHAVDEEGAFIRFGYFYPFEVGNADACQPGARAALNGTLSITALDAPPVLDDITHYYGAQASLFDYAGGSGVGGGGFYCAAGTGFVGWDSFLTRSGTVIKTAVDWLTGFTFPKVDAYYGDMFPETDGSFWWGPMRFNMSGVQNDLAGFTFPGLDGSEVKLIEMWRDGGGHLYANLADGSIIGSDSSGSGRYPRSYTIPFRTSFNAMFRQQGGAFALTDENGGLFADSILTPDRIAYYGSGGEMIKEYQMPSGVITEILRVRAGHLFVMATGITGSYPTRL